MTLGALTLAGTLDVTVAPQGGAPTVEVSSVTLDEHCKVALWGNYKTIYGGKSVVVLRVNGTAPETLPQLIDGASGNPLNKLPLQMKWLGNELCIRAVGTMLMIR